MRRLLRPRVVLPFILSVCLIAALLTYADVHTVFSAIAHFRLIYLLPFLLLMATYEGVRCVQWHFLLKALAIDAPPRTGAFTFLVGEIAKTLPFGQYLRNYLLRQSGGANIGQSVPATMTTLLIEDAVSLVGVLLLGVGSWTWLRPMIVLSAATFGVGLWIIYRLIVTSRMPAWARRRRISRSLVHELRLFRAGTARLANPRTLALQVAFGATYLILGAAALYMIVLGLGVTGIAFPRVLAVYFFSLAVGLLIPIPVDLGLIELSGTTAFVAVGVGRSAAVSAMLLNRVLSGAASLVIALATIIVLRAELRAAMAERRRPPEIPTRAAEPARDPTVALTEIESTIESTPALLIERTERTLVQAAPVTRPLGDYCGDYRGGPASPRAPWQ